MMDLYQKLCDIMGRDHVKEQEPMSKHTTFRVGGPADYFLTPETTKQMKQLLKLCKAAAVPCFVMGNGSNLLVGDKGYRGIVINIGKLWSEICIEEKKVTAGAGVLLSKLAKEIADGSLAGFEFASGIPGTLGGAVVMNAGAYGGEMKDILISATVMNENGQIITLSKEELELGYRTSCIIKKNYILLEATLLLLEGNKEEIISRMEELNKRRKEKQPLEYPSAGSTFKRPVGHFAGKLIMDSGLAGFKVGGAMVSSKHCGFVINEDHAKATDILELCKQVKAIVKEKFDVELELEVKTIGEF